MKLHILLTCFLGILLVSSVANGTITRVGEYWNGTGDVTGNYITSEANAYAAYGDNYEHSYANGGYGYQTSTAGTFDYWYFYDVSAYAYVYCVTENGIGAGAEASAGGDFGSGLSVDVFAGWLDIVPPANDYTESDDPDYESDSGTVALGKYDKVYCWHSVDAEALQTGGDNPNWTTSNAEAAALIALSE